jgi:hypothetical protein
MLLYCNESRVDGQKGQLACAAVAHATVEQDALASSGH